MNDPYDNAPPAPHLSDATPVSDNGRTGSVAFFDLDGTLVAGQTTFLLIGFLRRVGIVSRAFLVGTALWFLGYKLGLVKVSEKSREKGAGVFRGLSETEVEALMARFTEEVLTPRFHPAATAALAEHLAEGDRVVVISAALEPVVRALCLRLGVQEYVGTPCEVVDGRYTGRLTGPSPHADEKTRVAAAYMSRWGADPEDCWAYADHGTDLGLLRSVGRPVAVNPKPSLREAAERAGWPILP